MADKRRKRAPVTASCVEDASKEYHAVDMSDAVAQRRRRSECNSNSGAGSSSRGESWMTKVTAAMSQRMFAGKKLGASRSTQVMPLATTPAPTGAGLDGGSRAPAASTSASSSAHSDASSLPGAGQKQQQQQTLRQVSSENSLARTTMELAVVAQLHSTPVERVDFCPSVVCDIAAGDDSDSDDGSKHARTHRQSVLQTIRVQSAQRSHPASQRSIATKCAVIEKVVPRAQEHGDDDFEIRVNGEIMSQRRWHASCTERPHAAGLDRDDCSTYSSSETTRGWEAESEEARPSVSATAPILKDFFSRSAATGLGIRVQQRESRRKALYQTSHERQARLREHAEADALEAAAQLRKLRAEQLQRANQQRRAHVRREAASAHKHLTSRLAREQMQFVLERERWEGEFEDEMRLLSDAFRKASAKTKHADTDSSNTMASDRPMTVAGLAVPEALSQIRRDANNYERRLKTAAPRRPLAREWDALGIDSSRRHGSIAAAAVSRDGSTDVFALVSDGERDFEAIAFEAEAPDDGNCDGVGSSRGTGAPRGPDDSSATHSYTLGELLNERQSLLQRIAALEALVGATVT